MPRLWVSLYRIVMVGGELNGWFCCKNIAETEVAADRPPTRKADPPDQTIGFPLLCTP